MTNIPLMEWYNVRLLVGGKEYKTILVFAEDIAGAKSSAIFQARVYNKNASITPVSVWKEGEKDEFLENLMSQLFDNP